MKASAVRDSGAFVSACDSLYRRWGTGPQMSNLRPVLPYGDVVCDIFCAGWFPCRAHLRMNGGANLVTGGC